MHTISYYFEEPFISWWNWKLIGVLRKYQVIIIPFCLTDKDVTFWLLPTKNSAPLPLDVIWDSVLCEDTRRLYLTVT